MRGTPRGTAKASPSSIAKTFTAEAAIDITNAALQIHGAYGYSRELPLERIARDARMFTIGGGTSQMLRNLIAASLRGKRFPRPSASGPGGLGDSRQGRPGSPLRGRRMP